jgi:hypothetical protein
MASRVRQTPCRRITSPAWIQAPSRRPTCSIGFGRQGEHRVAHRLRSKEDQVGRAGEPHGSERRVPSGEKRGQADGRGEHPDGLPRNDAQRRAQA